MPAIRSTPRDLDRASVATKPALDLNVQDLYLDDRGIEIQPSAFCRQVPTRLRDPDLAPLRVSPIQHVSGSLRQASAESPPGPTPPG